MSFLKRLFGGGAGGEDSGLYFYVRPADCDEIIKIRIDAKNDLSMSEEHDGFNVRKMLSAYDWRCRKGVELNLRFDASRRLDETQVSNGELVTEADWEAWQAAKTGS